MVYKNFRIHTIFRVIVLTATIFLLFYLLNNTEFYNSSMLVAMLIVAQVIWLIRHVNKTNYYLTSFLEAIKYSEFTRSFELEGLGSSFDELKGVFNNVLSEFQKIRDEKEEQYFFLQNVIQHIGISMIAYQKNGKVEMYNNATKRMFRKSNLRFIQDLGDVSLELVSVLQKLQTGEKALVKLQDCDDIFQIIIYAKEFKIRDQMLTLVSIQNIQNELEEKEMEAWQKLIRVLTHEIMNSITPIVSLTSTVNNMVNELKQDGGKNLPEDVVESFNDISGALQTINKRSSGLLHFVETYRNLTRIPKPNFAIFKVSEIFRNILSLLDKDLEKANVSLKINIAPADLEITADEELIEQVLINLIKNSIHALVNTEKPEITLRAYLSERAKIIIQIEDNGQGIIKEVLDKIFIPFFTTKPSGSGIGLSLSRQIIRLHGGTISAQSVPNEKTTFTMRF
ncbi:MAG: ATP-binding protein [Bacteroidota bacterium]|nr:ATP-binding protein [Bacteroidota bacterium]